MKPVLWLMLSVSGIAAPALAARIAEETSALPRVLLIGDSIAGGYAPFVQEALKNTAEVVLVKRAIPNGASDNGIEEIDTWLAGQQWAVIHFNWGLWDLKVGEDGRNNIPIEQYGKNLRDLVEKMKQSGATLIFATTTPVPERVLITNRRSADAVLYNAVALKIMEENQIHVDDLYTAVLPRLVELQYPNDVHFNSDGSQFLAQRVVKAIEFMLYLRKVRK
jgi:lysophospholipase L1-like esterase